MEYKSLTQTVHIFVPSIAIRADLADKWSKTLVTLNITEFLYLRIMRCIIALTVAQMVLQSVLLLVRLVAAGLGTPERLGECARHCGRYVRCAVRGSRCGCRGG